MKELDLLFPEKKKAILSIRDIANKVSSIEDKKPWLTDDFALLRNVSDLSCAVPVKTDHYALILSKKGRSIKASGRSETEILPFSLHFISPGAIHAYQDASEDLDWEMILFTRKFIAGSYLKENVFDQLIGLDHLVSPYFELSQGQFTKMMALVECIDMELNSEAPYTLEAVRLLVIYCLYELNRAAGKESSLSLGKQNRQQLLVVSFRQMVDEEFLTLKTVKEYADRLKISTRYLSKIVFEETGSNPLHIIHNRLYLEARYLLSSGCYSIKQISYHLGFDTSSHFGRFYRQRSGQSPTANRNSTETCKI